MAGQNIHQSFTSWWTTRHVDIHWHNSVTAPGDTITIMIITATICATTHRNHPSGLWHLVVYLSEGRRHLVCERTSHDHDIGLTRRGTENDTETILIVTRGGEMHHFDGAAGQSEGHGPQGGLARPVGYLIQGCPKGQRMLDMYVYRLLI